MDGPNNRNSSPRLADLAQLVRLPAALSVPGDVLAGAAASAGTPPPRILGTMASSIALYWAGMALNDYADATVDAVERPQRPVPSGRVERRTALATACALTAAGLGLAALTGGRRALGVALPLTGLVWAYDLGLKSTPAGPAAMAGARTLNVLAGAQPGHRASALPAALLVGAHTYTVTALSRHEVSGAPREVPVATLAGSTATAVAAAALPGLRKHGRTARIGAAVGALAYLGSYGTAQVRAAREPSATNVRNAVGTGIMSLMPLQAALTAGGGRAGLAGVLAAAHPLARRLARKVSPT
ncbi:MULTISPECIES: SCO3242 family prenyltransferase [unclassified Streptomyces]|uniref:SCO3242 family prenyltransferase n=1 Tax=unclassified Streptomyces TaxID=2593676 RepID=UPI002251FDF5|nr:MULTISPECIES: UbiA family prenyltransferase [unclassified Streptomyces]MCX5337379.1 UbiA family prenyltransferase [Streptomyces sp. NBC_00140]MCX5365670.1 UbiA family prenyltransferase [Streptomyces sp. NBC_00124]